MLTRAARDLVVERPVYAMEAGLLAIHWLSPGYGYEITGADVWAAYATRSRPAREAGVESDVRDPVRQVVGDQSCRSVGQAIGREFGF